MLSIYLKKNEKVFKIERDKPQPNLEFFQDYSSRKLEDLK
jgi:hypothetical protein